MSKLLLDGDVLCYRAAFSCNGPDDTLQMAITKVNELVNNILDYLTDNDLFTMQGIDYQIYLTGKGNFRHDIVDTYKAQRTAIEKPRFLAEIRQHLMNRWDAIVSEGEEADDLIAIEATRLEGNCTIVSVDKDFQQVPSMNYNPSSGVFTQVTKDSGNKAFYMQCLTGDRVDNIPGLPGIGPKKAEKLLAGLTTEADLLNAVYDAYKEQYPTTFHKEFMANAQCLWLRRYPGEIWSPPV